MKPAAALKIDQHDLNNRLDFIGLDEAGRESLRRLKPLIEQELPVGLESFYNKVRATPEISKFFESNDHMERAQSAQLGHWQGIADGKFDGEYSKNVHKIGSVHAQIKLEPRWYIGGYSLLLEHIIGKFVEENWSSGGLFAKKKMSSQEFSCSITSLVKAVMLDMDLAISVYIEKAEEAEQAATEKAIQSERELIAETFGKATQAISSKELSYRIKTDVPPAYQDLKVNFNKAMEQLAQTIEKVGDASEQILVGSQQISNASSDLAKRTELQAATVEETAAALEETTVAMQASTKSAEEAGEVVARTKAHAESSGVVVEKAIAAMGKIEKSSDEIAKIIGVIDDIAFQTNLLALNAGVEAARAGEAGRGFAVVAQEVRELAQRSANAAKEIKKLIVSSGESVRDGVTLVNEAGSELEAIVGEVMEINENVTAIVASAAEQSLGLQEINQSVNSIDQATQQNAAVAEQSTSASYSLTEEVSNIDNMLKEFKTGKDGPRPQMATRQNTPVAHPSPARELTKKVANSFNPANNAPPAPSPATSDESWDEF